MTMVPVCIKDPISLFLLLLGFLCVPELMLQEKRAMSFIYIIISRINELTSSHEIAKSQCYVAVCRKLYLIPAMRQRFPPRLKTSQYWYSKESWTCTPMKQWSEKGVNGETAGEFQVSHSRMFHEQFVHDAKVTNGWIYDLYIWTTPPISSKAGYHRNAWNLYKMFEQRQNQSGRVSGVQRTSFIFTPQLSIRPIARAAQENSLFWAVKGLLSCVWCFPHLIL